MRRWREAGLGMAVMAAAGLSVGAAAALAADPPDGDGQRRQTRNHFFLRGGGAHLGVALEDVGPDDVSRARLDDEQGAVVTSVAPDSPAAHAGLQKGDVIVRYEGETVHSAAQLARLVRETPPGRKVTIEASRDGSSQRLAATLEGGHGGRGPGDRFALEIPEPPDAPEALEAPEPMEAPEAPEPPAPPRAPHAPRPPRAPREMGRFALPVPPDMENFDFRMGDMLGGDGDAFREIIRAGRPRRLGISYQELGDQLAAYFKAPEGSVLVTRVDASGPAAKAGVKAGDIILKFNGKDVAGRGLREEVESAEPGSEATLGVQREGHSLELRVPLPKRDRAALRPGEKT